jgi:hypothetical protein
MEVSGQLHAPAALPPGKGLTVLYLEGTFMLIFEFLSFSFQSSFRHCFILICHRPLKCNIALSRQHIITSSFFNLGVLFLARQLAGYRVRNFLCILMPYTRRWSKTAMLKRKLHSLLKLNICTLVTCIKSILRNSGVFSDEWNQFTKTRLTEPTHKTTRNTDDLLWRNTTITGIHSRILSN